MTTFKGLWLSNGRKLEWLCWSSVQWICFLPLCGMSLVPWYIQCVLSNKFLARIYSTKNRHSATHPLIDKYFLSCLVLIKILQYLINISRLSKYLFNIFVNISLELKNLFRSITIMLAFPLFQWFFWNRNFLIFCYYSKFCFNLMLVLQYWTA
jgi:hypothetical protein